MFVVKRTWGLEVELSSRTLAYHPKALGSIARTTKN
jgi:hypothetical protein